MEPSQNSGLNGSQNGYIPVTEQNLGPVDSPKPLSNLPADALSQGEIEDVPLGSMRQGPANLLRFNKWALLFSAGTLLLVVGIGVVTLLLANRHPNGQLNSALQQPANQYDVKGLPLATVNPASQLSAITGASSVAINGQLQVGNTFVVTPTATPSIPKVGQIYFNKDTNTPFIYDGTAFKSLTGVESLGGASGDVTVGNGLQLTNNQLSISGQLLNTLQQQSGSVVTTVQGQSGVVAFTAGSGISINGMTISSTGVKTIVGAVGITVAQNNGSVTVSLPQLLGTADTPTFTGVQLASALGIGSGGTNSNGSGYTSGGMFYFDGTSFVTTPAPASDGLCLVSTVSGPKFTACSGTASVASINGANGAVIIDNATANTTTSHITLNDASTTQKGIASFSSSDFSVSAGTVALASNVTKQGNTFNGSSQLVRLDVGGQALTAGQCLLSTAAGVAFSSCPVGGNIASGTAQTAGALTKFDSTTNRITNSIASESGSTITVAGTVTASFFQGSGASLTNLNAGNIASGTLSVARGGTGQTSFTANSVLLGNGTSGFGEVTPGSDGQCLVMVSGAPIFATCTGAGGVSSINGMNGALTLQGDNGVTVSSAGGVVTITGPTIGTGVTSLNGQTSAVTLADASAAGGVVTINDASTTQKGIASYDANNFSVTSGVVSTIQGIGTTATPTFGGLILQSATAALSGVSGSGTTTLQFATQSGNDTKTVTIPNRSGTVAVGVSGPLVMSADGVISCPGCLSTGGSGTAGVTDVNGVSNSVSVVAGTGITVGTAGSTITISAIAPPAGVSSLNGQTGALSLADATTSGTTITINDASTTQKGIASFSGSDFSVTGGAVSLGLSVTKAGNSFNTANGLLKLDASGWLPALNGSQLTNLDAGSITTGTLGIANGGTGITTTPTAGQLLIGNTAGTAYALGTIHSTGNTATITQDANGINIEVANASSIGTCTSCADNTLSNLGLTAVNADLLPGTSGTINVGSSSKIFGSGYFTNLSGNGSGVTNVNAAQLSGQTSAYYTNASNIVSGTLNDTRLSTNVALYNNAVSNFTGALQQNGAAVCTTAGNCIGPAATLQSAYNAGNVITTTDARNITFGLADTTTDSNFVVNVASGSTSQFKIQNNGSDVVSVGAAGQLSLVVQGSAGGLAVGGDTLLYRSGTNRLQMNNALVLRNTTDTSTALQIQNAAGANVVTVDTVNKSLSVGAPVTYTMLTYSSGFGFSAATNYGAGTNPYTVVTADFNGDGKQDVAYGNYGSNSVMVRLNNGDGTLAASVTYATSSAPRGIAAADLNGDGKLDLVVTNYSTATISVFLGNGDGTFQAKVDYTTSSYPYSVTTADFNGDGKLDVAVASYGAGAVSVLMGNGNGTLQTKVDYAAGTYPESVVATDFNGDSKPDLVVANSGSNNISVLMGNGDGTFQAQSVYASGSAPLYIATGDLNGDGKQDVVEANRSGSNVGVYLGNGDGTLRSVVYYTAGTNPYSVAIADLNGDGKQDLVVASAGSSTVSVLLGNGDGTFQSKVDYTAGTNPYSVAATDLNGDGKQDLVVANFGDNTVSVLLNGSTATPQTVTGALTSQAASASSSALILQGANGQTVDIFHVQDSAQNPLFGISQTGKVGIGNITNLDSSSSLLNVAGGAQFQGGIIEKAPNLYGGNLLDLQVNNVSKFKVDQSGNTTTAGTLAVSGPARTFATLSYGGGSGFSTAAGYSTGAAPYDIQSADFNKDGKRDVVTANSTAATVSVSLGNGDGTLGYKTDYAVGTDPVRLRLADVNKDGNVDIITANRAGSSISVLLGNGNGTFQTAVNYPTGHFPSALAIADINGDGKLDVVTVGYAGGGSSVYVTKLLGNGNGTFQAETAIQTLADAAAYSGVYGYINVADLSGDGKPDLSFGQSSDSVAGYQWLALGNGDGTFQAATKLSASSYNAHGAVATDLNGDGKPDIAFGSGSTVYVFLNVNGTFGSPLTYTAQAGLSSIYAADFNGDGVTDLATGSSTVGQIQVAAGNGNGTFQTPTSYSLGGVSFGLIGADLTGDGKPELLAVNRNGTGMAYILVNGGPVTSSIVHATTSITTASSSTAGLVLQSSASQTADLMRLQDANANSLFEIAGNGKVGVGNFQNLSNSSYLLNVAGNIQANTVNGFIGNLLNLQVDGVSVLRVDQAGNTTIGGTLNVAGAATVASLTVNGHIISGGRTPTVTALAGNCDLAGTATITGNDTAGIITLTPNSGATCSTTDASVLDAMTITYATPYGSKPIVMITPASSSDLVTSGSGSGSNIIVDDAASSATQFTAAYHQVVGSTTVWYYHVIQ